MEDELKVLPETTAEKLNEEGANFHSDKYLFETANLASDKMIITTDVKLKNQMGEDSHFQVVLLEDFLNDYE